MELLTNMDPLVYTSIKILLLCASIAVFLISYFHANEARKAEKRLRLRLPFFVRSLLSFQIFSSFTLFVTAVFALILGL